MDSLQEVMLQKQQFLQEFQIQSQSQDLELEQPQTESEFIYGAEDGCEALSDSRAHLDDQHRRRRDQLSESQ